MSPIAGSAAGTLLVAACFLLAGASTGLIGLLIALLLGGVGASVQHPIAASIVSSAFDGIRSRTALGVYNFTGDVGKMALPALTAVLLTLMAWRPALWIVAGIGIVVAMLLLVLAPRPTSQSAAKPQGNDEASSTGQKPSTTFGFRLLFAISLIDSAARWAF